MNGPAAALRYARALHDVAAAADKVDAVHDDIAAITRILDETPRVREFCSDREGSIARAVEFVDLAFCPYIGELTARTLHIAAENGRLEIVPHLPGAFDRVLAEIAEVEHVILETAQPANDELLRTVKDRMSRRLNKTVEVETRVNPAMLGGIRILWQDRMIDDSALSRLHALGRRIGNTA